MRKIELNAYNLYINKESVVYDIGAHIGETALIFAQKNAKHIYAFEPSSFNFLKLKENTKNIKNISNFDVALHNKKYLCKTRFRDCSTDGEEDREQNIKYVILEDFIKENDIKNPDFIKIDIEGMESILLTTFKSIFEESRPIIYLEIHAKAKDLDIQNYKDCPHWIWPEDGGFNFNSLKNKNYSIFCEKRNWIPIEDNWNPSPADHIGCILFPNEKLN